MSKVTLRTTYEFRDMVQEVLNIGRAKFQANLANVREVHENEAEPILTLLPTLVFAAASNGERFMNIYELNDKTDVLPRTFHAQHERLEPEELSGTAKIVFDYCTVAGLSPTLEYDPARALWRIFIHF